MQGHCVVAMADTIEQLDRRLQSFETTLFNENYDEDIHPVVNRLVKIISSVDLEEKPLVALPNSAFHQELKRPFLAAKLVYDESNKLLQQDARNKTIHSLHERSKLVCYALSDAKQIVESIRKLTDNLSNRQVPEGFSLGAEDVEGLNKAQKLIMFCIDIAWKNGFAKFADNVYERIRTASGQPTSSWKIVCSISEFVYKYCDRNTSFEQWTQLTSSGNVIGHVTNYLTNMEDQLFPTLRSDRHLIGFIDGLYVTNEDRFYLHKDVPEKFRHHATARYFDVPFPTETIGRAFDEIETPSIQSIISYQEFPPDVTEWFYVFLGRLLYEVGELDNWQVIGFFLGMAQSGKSTVLTNVAARFFASEFVGVLSNNVEKKFGLSGFYDKHLFIAPEVSENLSLDQAEFQSLVSGDMMQIAKKNETAKMVEWKTPGILAGNQVPGWKDTAGSIVRRIVIFKFGKAVTEADTTLPRKLQQETPLCLIKCNKAYLNMVGKVGSKGIWKVLPEYFSQQRAELQECVNVMYGFLKSGNIILDATSYVPWKNFMKAFKEYCTQSNQTYAAGKRSESMYLSCLREMNCSKSGVETRKYPRGNEGTDKTDVWLVGADLPPHSQFA